MSKGKKFLALSLPLIFIITVVGLFIGLEIFNKDREKKRTKPKKVVKKEKKELIYCPVDGLPVSNQDDLKRPIFVMVENSYTTRPQSGINQACLVMEGLAEGGITRLGLVFIHSNPLMIGPVRSARSHFVSFAYGFDSIFVHCGGSKYALSDIKEWGITDFDQFRYESAFWREKGKRSPHNLFSTIGRLRRISESNGLKIEGVTYQGFNHKEELPLEKRPQLGKLTIKFSTKLYQVDYEYNRDKNIFSRFNGGQPHLDELDNRQIEVANVVIVYAKTRNLPDPDGVLDVEIIGVGKADYFIDGIKLEGRWKKLEHQSQIIFKDLEGNPIEFNPGQIWVEVVKEDTQIIWESGEQE